MATNNDDFNLGRFLFRKALGGGAFWVGSAVGGPLLGIALAILVGSGGDGDSTDPPDIDAGCF